MLKKEKLALIQNGDIIDFQTKVLTPKGLQDAGIESAQVIGKTENSALIKSKKIAGFTIAIQAHQIVAAFRGSETVFVDIEEKLD